MAPAAHSALTLSRLLLCEGPDDEAFFKTLIDQRKLPDFHIRSTGQDRHSRGGNSKFGEKLRVLRLDRGFKNLKDIVLVTDADDDPAASFNNVCAQLSNLNWPTIPAAPNLKAGNNPSISIIILPFSGVGSLETYCLEAARSVDAQLSSNVDTFQSLVTNRNWTQLKKDKLWIRSMLAGHCKKDPMVDFVPAMIDYRYGNPIPVKHKSFNGISNILKSYG